MEIVIAGGRGFIGRNLCSHLQRAGHDVTTIGREDLASKALKSQIEGKDVMINLMGEPISGRWTASKKGRIMDSRLKSTNILVEAVSEMKEKPLVWVQGSAVGIYDKEHIHTEDSLYFANDFLSEVVQSWEQNAIRIKSTGIRLVILRMGVVLGKDGGMLKKVLLPGKFGVGIQPGAGNGAFPFIHMSDLLRIFELVIDDSRMRGIVNAVSPQRISFNDMYRQLFQVLKPFIKLKFPEGILGLIFGEGASALTQGQIVVPEILEKYGFAYEFAHIKEALEDIINDM